MYKKNTPISLGARFRKFLPSNHLLPALLIAILCLSLFLSLSTESFATSKSLINLLEANSYRLILALGMLMVISSGGIDLSQGSIISLSAILAALGMKQGLPVSFCVLIAIVSGALLGALNGLLINLTKLDAFILTLATSFMYRGLSLILTRGIPLTLLPADFRNFAAGDFLGMETGVGFALLLLLILIPIYRFMPWGHYLRSLGGNAQALARSGVSVGAYRISAYAFSGFTAALAGLIISARLNSAEANAGMNMQVHAICAVVMGGTPLEGGRGSLLGTFLAVILLGLVRQGLTILSISAYYQEFITGGLLLAALIFAELREVKTRPKNS